MNNWTKKTVIEDKIRFTFQFAKRFGWFTARYGIKESTGGIGADADVPWINRNMRLSADVFDATFDRFPRVKLTAAMEVFKHVYVLGGVDELLNTPVTLNATSTPAGIVSGNSDVPVQFSQFHYGRDYFAGGMLRFTDEDLAALLTVGGSAIAGAGGK